MSKRTRTALIVLGLLAALALLAPWITPYSHEHIDWERQAVSPQLEAAHWLGTDRLGRDLFARSMQALRVSLLLPLRKPPSERTLSQNPPCVTGPPEGWPLGMNRTGGRTPLYWFMYIMQPSPSWRRFERHCVVLALSRARPSAGRRMPTRTAMMPITTRSSTSVNAC